MDHQGGFFHDVQRHLMQVMEDYDHEKGDGAILHNMIESIKPNFQQGSTRSLDLFSIFL